MKVREVIRMLEEDGWHQVATRGSHRQFGKTREEVEKAVRDAIEFHLDGLREDGEPIPSPHSYSTYCEITA